MLNNNKNIIAPSGAVVELKEVRGVLTIVYQLDKNKKRITQLNAKGEASFLIGIVTTSKIKDQLL